MVSSLKRRGGDAGRRVPGGSRVSGSLGMVKGFRIYKEEEEEGGKTGGGGAGATRAVSRKSVAATSSMKTSALSGMHANKVLSSRQCITNCKGVKKDILAKNNSVVLKPARKALADVGNLTNGRSYQLRSQKNSTAGLKKDSAGKSSILKSKMQSGAKILRVPRKSLTKSTVAVDALSSKVSGSQDKKEAGYRLVRRHGTASDIKDSSRHQSNVGTKARMQVQKGGLLTGGNSNARFLFHRPWLSSRRSVSLNVSSKKADVESGWKSRAKPKAKPMCTSGNVDLSSRNGMSNSSCLQGAPSESSQNNLADKRQLAGTESCVGNDAAPQPRQKCTTRRRSYTLSLMSGSKVIGQFTTGVSNLPEIDNCANPLEVVEYVDDIYEYYWNMENQNPLLENYLVHQRRISSRMRGVLINWLVEVHLKFALMQETLFLMVELLDRALSVIPIEKGELQLVGLTVLLLASKYEDYWHPKVKELISISVCSYTKQQMLAMEMLILKRLKFRIALPTPYVFMLRFLKASQSEKKLEHLAFYLVELCLVEYEALKFKPSLLCASAVYLARCTLQVNPAWSELLKRHARYEEKELRTCANMILGFQKAASTNKLETTYEKFLDPHLDCVAKIKAIEKLPQ